jgi:hypothetical protein
MMRAALNRSKDSTTPEVQLSRLCNKGAQMSEWNPKL